MNVTIIGGGVVGMSAALFLQRLGIGVVVVDPGDDRARASYGNAGAISSGSVVPLALPGILAKTPSMLLDPAAPLHIAPGYFMRALPWLLRFVWSARPASVAHSVQALNALFSETFDALDMLLDESEARDLVRRSGQLHLYPDAEARTADERVWTIRRQSGHECVAIDRGEIERLEPAVGPGYRAGVFLPAEGMVIDPQAYLDRLVAAFRSNGGDMERGEVRAVRENSGRFVLELGDRRLSADTLLVAAGARSGRIAAELGSKVPLETQRGYHVMLPQSGIALSRPVVAADRKCFATPMAGGLRLAGTVEIAGLDAPPTPARAAFLLDHGRALFPNLADKDATVWMGHRPCLPDSLPVIGRSPRFPNVYFAFGHGHLGMTGAAPTGRHIANLITGRATGIDLAPFAVDRF